MAVYERLKYLIESLSVVEKKEIEGLLRTEEKAFVKLFHDIQTKSYEELILNDTRRKDNHKTFIDNATYLMNKILRHFSVNPTDEPSQDLLKVNEIVFLLNHDLNDLAWAETNKLMSRIDTKEHGWIGVYLLKLFWDKKESFKNLKYVNALYHYVSQFAGFTFGNSDPHQSFVRFIEAYRMETISVDNKLSEMNDQIWKLPFDSFPIFGLKMKLLLEKTAFLIEQYPFLKSKTMADDFIQQVEQEYLNTATHKFSPLAPYSVSAYYADSVLSSANLMFKLNDVPIEEFTSRYYLDEKLIHDIALRFEINALIMRVFGYSSQDDKKSNEYEKLRKDLLYLIKKSLDCLEVSIFLKTLIILFEKFYGPKPPSTQYKYISEVKAFGAGYEVLLSEYAAIANPNISNRFIDVLYRFRQNCKP